MINLSKPKPKPDLKPEPEPKIKAKVIEKQSEDFDELRHKFSKKEIDMCRKAFYVAKNKKYLSESEMK